MLRELSLKAVYRSDQDNILKDFYIPALSVSVQYDRAVGFFSASMLSYAAQGISAFLQNNGHMRLIIGGEIEPEDEYAIRQGYNLRDVVNRLGQKIISIIDHIDDTLFYRRIEALSWLVASGHLDIKIALRKKGMYHEKIGILTDRNSDRIVFQGAANETVNALLPDFNFESINVFQCWRQEFTEHFMPYIVGFENLWQNRAPNTLVLDFPEAAKEKLVKIAKKAHTPLTSQVELELWNKLTNKDDGKNVELLPKIPFLLNGYEFEIKAHQITGLNAWKSNGFRGILAHATGSGKTITSIYGAIKVFEATNKLFLIIAVPYQTLADQWCSILREFNIFPIQCYENTDRWLLKLSEFVSLYAQGALRFVCVVVVNRTLQSKDFQRLIRQVPGEHMLWIGDECHYHGSLGFSNALPSQAKLRLGLSATPEHYLNKSMNDRLQDFYGSIVHTYSLQDAIKEGILSPYFYYIEPVDLTEYEAEKYYELSGKISQLMAQNNEDSIYMSDNSQLNFLLFQRARLLGHATNKINALRNLLRNKKPTPLTLFYCGDGSTEDEDGTETTQLDLVTKTLYDLGWKCSRFTSHEKREERETLLNHFRIGTIDALVAIRCLDEGIDIPACRTAYILASSRNPKQFVQRRGRILRRSPGKESAEIYDFFVKLPENIANNNQYERSLISAELKRVSEFVQLSENPTDSITSLSELLQKYDLTHLLF